MCTIPKGEASCTYQCIISIHVYEHVVDLHCYIKTAGHCDSLEGNSRRYVDIYIEYNRHNTCRYIYIQFHIILWYAQDICFTVPQPLSSSYFSNAHLSPSIDWTCQNLPRESPASLESLARYFLAPAQGVNLFPPKKCPATCRRALDFSGKTLGMRGREGSWISYKCSSLCLERIHVNFFFSKRQTWEIGCMTWWYRVIFPKDI